MRFRRLFSLEEVRIATRWRGVLVGLDKSNFSKEPYLLIWLLDHSKIFTGVSGGCFTLRRWRIAFRWRGVVLSLEKSNVLKESNLLIWPLYRSRVVFHTWIIDAIGWHPIIEAIPSTSTPKGQKDEIVWLDLPNQSFSVKVAWEQLRIHHQMVDWHDIVWFKNAVPRHAFLLWVAIQRKLNAG